MLPSNRVKCINCNIIICEVLAFVQNKIDVMDEEGLIRICETAFTEKDIEEAKSLLFEALKKRITTRKRAGKTQRNMDDIITLIKGTDPEKIPLFVAKDLEKLPPVTFDHIDVTPLLKKILVLQNNVENIKQNYVTRAELQDQLLINRESSKYENQYVNVNKRGGYLLSTSTLDSGPMALSVCSSSPERVGDSAQSEVLPPTPPPMPPSQIKDTPFKAADTKIPLYISNVHVEVTEQDIIDYVPERTGETVSLVKIKMSKQRQYNAFKVFVTKYNIEKFLNDNVWPTGITFRKFINFHKEKPRRGPSIVSEANLKQT